MCSIFEYGNSMCPCIAKSENLRFRFVSAPDFSYICKPFRAAIAAAGDGVEQGPGLLWRG